MSVGRAPWDSGLQIERTKLAWQRTALSTLAFSLLISRLIATRSWPAALVVGLAAVVAALALGITATHRYRRGDRALRGNAVLPGARSFAALTALVLITAAGAAVYLATSWR